MLFALKRFLIFLGIIILMPVALTITWMLLQAFGWFLWVFLGV